MNKLEEMIAWQNIMNQIMPKVRKEMEEHPEEITTTDEMFLKTIKHMSNEGFPYLGLEYSLIYNGWRRELDV